MFHPSGIPENERLNGISGWLLLFCISLFSYPVVYLVMATKSYGEIQPYFTHYPNFFYTTLFQYIYSGAFMLLGLYTGFRLTGHKSNAVGFTKIFLMILAIGSLIPIVFPLFYGFPVEETKQMILNYVIDSVRTIIWASIWFVYLGKSKRVKYTYSEQIS